MSAQAVRLFRQLENIASRDLPVVVLESTVIAQGLPWPENLHTALAMEAAVREKGAFPATVAILGGEVRIGLSAAEIEDLSRSAALQGSNHAGALGDRIPASIRQGEPA